MNYFGSFREWGGCVKDAATHFKSGFVLIARALFVGVFSLLRALWRYLSKQVGKYPSFALGSFLVAFFMIWLLTFVCMRARAVSAEDLYNKKSYEYAVFKEQHGYE